MDKIKKKIVLYSRRASFKQGYVDISEKGVPIRQILSKTHTVGPLK